MTQKWVWLSQETVPSAQIEQLSTLGTGSFSRDVDGHQQSCIFCWYQQETPSDKLESKQECGVGVEGGGQEDQNQGHMLAPLPGTVITVGEELARGWTSQGKWKQSKTT